MPDPTPPQRRIGPYEQSLIESRARREARQAELAERAARRRSRVIAAAVALLLLAAGVVGGLAWRNARGADSPTGASPSAAACPTRSTVSLWVSQAAQPALAAVAKEYEAEPASGCVHFAVTAKSPVEAMIGLGPGQPGRPDGWVPDSEQWVQRAKATAKLAAKPAAPFAKSPLVIAMDPQQAGRLSAQPSWRDLVAGDGTLRMSDPRSTTAGMLTLASALPGLSQEQDRTALPALARTTAASVDELFRAHDADPAQAPAFPVAEADLLQHNRVSPSHPMVSVTPREGTPPFEFSLVDVATDPARARLVEQLRAHLATPAAATVLAQYGLRSTAHPVAVASPKGSVGTVTVGASVDPASVTAATDAWQAVTADFSLLSVFDVSGSMKQKVGATTRMGVTQEAAGIALATLPPSTKLGLWMFSTDLGVNGVDYRELAPIGRLDDAQHRQAVAQALGSLSSHIGGGTGLYDTIWAAYQQAQQDYDPDRVNAVVILTDGRNDDPNGMTLQQLEARLQAAWDPQRPVAVTTIGVGPDVDPAALSQISTMTHSKFYAAPSAGDMKTVLARALFDHSCKNGRCV